MPGVDPNGLGRRAKRSLIVHSLIHALGLFNPSPGRARIQVITPRRASYKDLSTFHSKEYLDYILDKDNDGVTNPEFGLQDDAASFIGLSDYVPLVAGATLTACETLKQNYSDVAICWDGGRHHTHKSKASGFCYVADCVLAILSLKKLVPGPEPRKPRVMYLDLDLHFSDAVSEAFHTPSRPAGSSSQTLILSIHHASRGFFPASKLSGLSSISDAEYDPFTLSIPLNVGASDGTYGRIWPIVERVARTFSPDYTIVQCGADALAGDPYATFNWSLGSGEGSLGWCINRILTSWPGKHLLLGGGGYNSPNVARAWAYLTSLALESPLDLDSPIPEHSGFPLYGPSFTLDIPAGTMQDQNTEEYLSTIETSFESVIKDLAERVSN
ncbi:histone deacetylase 8 [Coprinopsis cinerea okayama7|uniref:histone deacetylase n=1 Tax=Coprinopsis cinerea (strain Okayama-7 / 130 / ATCC MYA-4618 / FGSC 9003) TaxID=240176 RepID=A8PCJ7_COPC7|nr:histone deacetylase 8 [Coprinopsis cinerea okayama7\|eukprot:XP_001840416.2 histone deacetylase 8 [Coprinopsis cinerea okayama7\